MVERRILLSVGVLVALLAAGLVVIGPSDFFLSEESTRVNESLMTSQENATVLKSGNFTGLAGHEVSGTVSLVRTDGDLFLQFENYSQTQGPDVFIYVTPANSPETESEVREGRKIRIDGGADDGESTKVGTFSQRLPDDVDPAAISGVSVWCEQFSTPFGMASLGPERL